MVSANILSTTHQNSNKGLFLPLHGRLYKLLSSLVPEPPSPLPLLSHPFFSYPSRFSFSSTFPALSIHAKSFTYFHDRPQTHTITMSAKEPSAGGAVEALNDTQMKFLASMMKNSKAKPDVDVSAPDCPSAGCFNLSCNHSNHSHNL